jgi:hypothetical protein
MLRIILLLSLSFTLQTKGVLTQLFILKARNDFCPILLVANVDVIQRAESGLELVARWENRRQMEGLKQVWSSDLERNTDRTPLLIESESRPMLLLYRDPLKLLAASGVHNSFGQLLSQVPFNPRHVTSIDCDDNQIISAAALSFSKLLESSVTIENIREEYVSFKTRIVQQFGDSNWLAAYCSPNAEWCDAVHSCFDTYINYANHTMSTFNDNTTHCPPGTRICDLEETLRKELYRDFKHAFMHLSVLDMYFRMATLSKQGDKNSHRIVIIADPLLIGALKTLLERTNHELLQSHFTPGLCLEDKTLELLIYVRLMLKQRLADQEAHPDSLRPTSSGVWVRRDPPDPGHSYCPCTLM